MRIAKDGASGKDDSGKRDVVPYVRAVYQVKLQRFLVVYGVLENGCCPSCRIRVEVGVMLRWDYH